LIIVLYVYILGTVIFSSMMFTDDNKTLKNSIRHHAVVLSCNETFATYLVDGAEVNGSINSGGCFDVCISENEIVPCPTLTPAIVLIVAFSIIGCILAPVACFVFGTREYRQRMANQPTSNI